MITKSFIVEQFIDDDLTNTKNIIENNCVCAHFQVRFAVVLRLQFI